MQSSEEKYLCNDDFSSFKQQLLPITSPMKLIFRLKTK